MGVSTSKPREIPSKYFNEFYEKDLPATLEGKVIAITGCTSGTGLVAAKAVTRKHATAVLLLNRASTRATQAFDAVTAVATECQSKTVIEPIDCDLQSFDSVKQAAATIRSKYDAIDVLCCNAGVMALDDYATQDGYDVQMQTNHLSHFLLSKLLYPALQKAAELRGEARIVSHSSGARRGGPLEAKYFAKNGGNLGGNDSFLFTGAKWERYQQSKLANAVFTLALTDRLAAANSKVIATVAAPGLAATNLQTTTSQSGGMGSISMALMYFAQSAEDGTMPLLSACFAPNASSGDLWQPGKPDQFHHFYGPAAKYDLKEEKNASDVGSRTMLWELSEAAVGEFKIE